MRGLGVFWSTASSIRGRVSSLAVWMQGREHRFTIEGLSNGAQLIRWNRPLSMPVPFSAASACLALIHLGELYLPGTHDPVGSKSAMPWGITSADVRAM